MNPNSPEWLIFSKLVRKKLSESGLRVTGSRLNVAKALFFADRPINAYALHASITEGGEKIDVVSVYRSLQVMVELGLAHYIHAGEGYQACTIGGHSHDFSEHAVCQDCGKVTELNVPLCATEDFASQLAELGFQPNHMRIEIEGRCADCAR